MTGIPDEGTLDCNLDYYDTFDRLITYVKKEKKDIKRETCFVTEPGQYYYTERAKLEVEVQNEEQEKKLTHWSYKSSRLDKRKKVLYHPNLDDGVGLPRLQLKLYSPKISILLLPIFQIETTCYQQTSVSQKTSKT